MNTVIVVPVQRQAPRRTITEQGITYREVRPGDDMSPRATGIVILLVVAWIAASIYAMLKHCDGDWPAFVPLGVVAAPFVFIGLLLTVFGG